MKKRRILMGFGLLAAFVLWTAAVRLLDVQPIGPEGSAVGFASVNGFVHRMTGVHMAMYHITDGLSLIPLGFAAGFGLLGLVQWIKRKQLIQVDRSIVVLGGFYLVVMAVYALFERMVINYRPVLIEGALEASYPSSTTVLVLCVMATAVLQLRARMRTARRNGWITAVMTAFSAFMVVGRLLSGVHWFTDIVGGILLSAGLVMLYWAMTEKTE